MGFMETRVHFLKVSSCVSKSTYKYYFPDTETGKALWDFLVERYGVPIENKYFNIKEITADKFILRTTSWNDPLTIIVKGDPDEEFAELHQTILK